jgi:hypothetical protein
MVFARGSQVVMRNCVWLGLAASLLAAPAEGQVLITEVQVNPNGDDAAEWVELHNTGTGVVTIGGWTLNDYGPTPPREFSFPMGTVLGPGQVVLVARQATQYQTMAALEVPPYAVLVPDYELADGADDLGVTNLVVSLSGAGGFALGNAGDGLQLRNDAGLVISTAEWGTGRNEVPGSPCSAPSSGGSISRVANTGSSDVDFVTAAVPNPGVGFGGSVPQPPTINNALRSPAALIHGGSFTLSADMVDADGIAGGEVYVAAATSSVGPASGGYVAVATTASGNTHSITGGVSAPAPGISIPAPTAFNQRYIRYWFYALDNGANDATAPALATTGAGNLAYFWENVLPATGLATIAEARVQDSRQLPRYDGHSVRIQGVALTTQEAFIRGRTNLFIADPGAGAVEAIRIFDDGLVATVNPGDLVTVTGKIGAYRGVRQVGRDERAGQPAVIGDEIVVQVNGTAAVPVHTVTVAQLLAAGEQYESSLVRLNGVQLVGAPATWPSDGNVDVTDGTGTLVVRVIAVTDLAGASAPGGAFNLQGILTQFAPTGTGGYQLQPRGLMDVMGGVVLDGGVPMDGGSVDSGVGVDTGVADTGTPPPDSGVPGDGGVNPGDSGVNPGDDSGVNPGVDSGVNPGADGGVAGDSGTTQRSDSGTFGGGGGSGTRDKGGCTCVADVAPEAPWSGLALGLVLFGALRRRRG